MRSRVFYLGGNAGNERGLPFPPTSSTCGITADPVLRCSIASRSRAEPRARPPPYLAPSKLRPRLPSEDDELHRCVGFETTNARSTKAPTHRLRPPIDLPEMDMHISTGVSVLAPAANETRMTADGGEGFEFNGMVFAVTEGPRRRRATQAGQPELLRRWQRHAGALGGCAGDNRGQAAVGVRARGRTPHRQRPEAMLRSREWERNIEMMLCAGCKGSLVCVVVRCTRPI
ncbi:hypothetical protein EJB05_47734, partial [Eragrostis curvula]